jgi:hypothetical protein
MKADLSLFSWNAKRSTLVCEASDLGLNFSMEEGLTVVSPTGTEVHFAFSNCVRDREGEIKFWELKTSHPKHAGIGMVVFND